MRRPFALLRRNSVLLVLLAVAGFLFGYPVVMLGVGAFRNTDPSLPPEWSGRGFEHAYTDSATYETLRNSLILSVSVTVISTVLAIALAFLVARTTTRLRRMVTPMMLFVLAMPPLFFAISWGMLGNARVGLLNEAVRKLVGSEDFTLVDVNSWTGLIGVTSLKATAFGYLLLIGPFLALDRSLEEASQVAGARRLGTFLRIDLPVLAPAITGVTILSFVIGLEFFDVPLLLGVPAGIRVFSTQIYGLINDQTPADYGAASALSMLLVAIVVILVFVQWRVLGSRQFTTITGKGYRTDPWHIGRWRYAGTALIVVYGLLALVLPLAQLVLGALQPYFGAYGQYTFDNFHLVLTDPTIVPAIRATLIVSVLGGLLAMALAVLIAYTVSHSRSRARRLLELCTWLPWAVPGVVLSLGMAWAYLSVPGLRQLYGTIWIVMLGLVVAAVPVASRAAQGAVAQVGRELEEAARTSGASPTRVFLSIVLRLIAPSFAAGWFVAAVVISGNLAVPILLSSPDNETVPVVVFGLYTSGETAQAAAVFVVVLALLGAGLLALTLANRLFLTSRRRTRIRPAEAVAEERAAAPVLGRQV